MSKLLEIKGLRKNYHDSPDSKDILKNLDLTVNKGDFLCILGPSGCGKTTLIRCIAGFEDYEGEILVDGEKVTKPGIDRIMVFQDFNQLFPWKTVRKNIEYPLKINGMKDKAEREKIAQEHLELVGLKDYGNFYPHQLSGGMKQKLALSCALIHKPDVLFLDEPTTGVDPVSRKEFWGMLRRLKEQGITIIASTPIIDEARQCDRIAFINEGEIKGIDTPDRILTRFAGILCPPGLQHERVENHENKVIEVEGLTKRFGNFTAVDHISFQVHRGEIFGFLGANGAGKTTAMRMLTGLSRPTGGKACVAGFDVASQPEEVKKNIGYMSQKFSLYEDLKVWENIRLFAGIYGIPEAEIAPKTEELLLRLGLEKERDTLVKSLPLGWKQKLAFSVSIFHRPKIVFLDEPTGGVDPATRRQFWELIYQAADEGITVFVTTHFMDEAEYCDRISIMVDGVIRALDTPGELKRQFNATTMDDVFQQLARQAVRTAD